MTGRANRLMDATALTIGLAHIAGHAQSLEAGREVIFDQPLVKGMAVLTDLVAMPSAVTIDVIDGQFFSGAAACAGRAVMRQNALPSLASSGHPICALPVVIGSSPGITEAFHMRAHSEGADSRDALISGFRSASTAGVRLLFADPWIPDGLLARAEYLLGGHSAGVVL